MTDTTSPKLPKAPSTALWSDARHHVRPVGRKDTHVMRFVVAAHDKTSILKRRHVSSLEDGIALAARADALMAGEKPLEAKGRRSAVPVSDQYVPEVKQDGRKLRAKPKPIEWSAERFDCYQANSVAQIWKCVAAKGSRASSKRREVPMDHELNQFMVMTIERKDNFDIPLKRVPIMQDDSPKVFHSYAEALDAFDSEYEDADPEFHHFHKNPSCVFSTLNFDVFHDVRQPGCSNKSPFYLWLRAFSRPHWVSTTHALFGVGGTSETDLRNNGADEEFIQFVRDARARAKKASQVPSLLSIAQSFKSIDLAIGVADLMDETKFNNEYLGPEGSRVIGGGDN